MCHSIYLFFFHQDDLNERKKEEKNCNFICLYIYMYIYRLIRWLYKCKIIHNDTHTHKYTVLLRIGKLTMNLFRVVCVPEIRRQQQKKRNSMKSWKKWK